MLISLFHIEVPEITEGNVRIKSIARIPGVRSKVAVETVTPTVDPIGACLGIKSIRLQSMIDELNGEYIDVVLWSDVLVKFIINVFFPITIMSLILDSNKKEVDLVVEKENLPQIIGRNGQNIKLSSMLVGFELNVISLNPREVYLDTEFLKKECLELKKMHSYLKDVLDIPDDILIAFLNYGIRTIEELICIPDLELTEKFNLSKNDLKKVRTNSLFYLRQIITN
jgi:N utilization substance protein A